MFYEEGGQKYRKECESTYEPTDQKVSYEVRSRENLLYNILQELSLEDFADNVGETDIAADPVLRNAYRIAEISFTRDFVLVDNLTNIDLITLYLFDNESLQVLIDKTSINNPSSSLLSLRGKLSSSPTAAFFLSLSEAQVLATLRLPKINTVYTVKYIHPADKHYLFKGLITEVEHYECDIRIPPVPGRVNQQVLLGEE